MRILHEAGLGHGAWENEGGAGAPVTLAHRTALPLYRGPRRGVPRFLNDAGAEVVAIGVTTFNCIGATPPSDHPHVYLDMGDRADILCPYCATHFRCDPALGREQTRPPGCFHPGDTGRHPANGVGA